MQKQLLYRRFCLIVCLVGGGGTGSECLTRPARAEVVDCTGVPEHFQLRTFHDGSGAHHYALFLPRHYTPDRKWPVVLFLHGAGEKGTDGLLPLSGTLAVALERWPDAPFIAVFPQCEDRTGRSLTGWLAESSDGRRALRILDQVERDFSVDPARRVLAGWSMGGYGAWSLAAANPRHWSSVLVLAGGAVPETVDLHGLASAKTPVWAISGEEDPLVSFTASQKLVEELNRQGGNGTFTLLEGAGHHICSQVFAEPRTFDWLFNPSSDLARSVSFKEIRPLPLRTQFYRHCRLHENRISDVLAFRIGNKELAELSEGVPEILPSESLQGSLAEIRQQVGQADDPWNVTLSGIQYRCQVERFQMQAISGGRLGVEVHLRPLELQIEETRLENHAHFVQAGPIRIQIGLHRPAIVKVEVQPEIRNGELKLIPLRKHFQFDDGNWYITPPRQVEVRSSVYTPAQMKSGIVGSLYESRQQLTDQVLSVLPKMLEALENQLGDRPAPELARMLSPIPSLIPEIEVGPSTVSTDSGGLSVIFDVQALSRLPGSSLPAQTPFSVREFSQGDRFQIDLMLDAITRLTAVNVDQNTAQVNVLDISDDIFAALADPRQMQPVLPELDVEPPGTLRTILRLLSPLSLTTAPSASGDRPAQAVEMMLSAEKVCLEVYDSRFGNAPLPIGRIVFRMSQPLTLLQPEDKREPNEPHSAKAVTAKSDSEDSLLVRWESRCDVVFLNAESLAGSTVPRVNASEFEDRFRAAWLHWAAKHGSHTMNTQVGRVGPATIHLQGVQSANGRLRFQLEVEKTR